MKGIRSHRSSYSLCHLGGVHRHHLVMFGWDVRQTVSAIDKQLSWTDSWMDGSLSASPRTCQSLCCDSRGPSLRYWYYLLQMCHAYVCFCPLRILKSHVYFCKSFPSMSFKLLQLWLRPSQSFLLFFSWWERPALRFLLNKLLPSLRVTSEVDTSTYGGCGNWTVSHFWLLPPCNPRTEPWIILTTVRCWL